MDRDEKARLMRRRLSKESAAEFRRVRRHRRLRERWRGVRPGRGPFDAFLLIAAALVLLIVAHSRTIPARWSFTDYVSHVAAAPSCAAARRAGVAPARRGEPGYWPQHDADRDGVACEPYPRD